MVFFVKKDTGALLRRCYGAAKALSRRSYRDQGAAPEFTRRSVNFYGAHAAIIGALTAFLRRSHFAYTAFTLRSRRVEAFVS